MAFVPAALASLGAFFGTTAGAATLAVGAGVAASKLLSPSPKSSSSPFPSSPPPLPQAPTPDASAEKAQELANKRRAALTKTVYTSPLGASDEAQIARKTLLGT